MTLHLCTDTSELVELCERYNFFLKPLRKVKACVQLPLLKVPGQTISSREVMDNLKKLIKPDEFIVLKVCKTHHQVIQLEGEVEKKITLTRVLQKLQGSTMKLNGFSDVLKIRAATAKLDFPTRHDWDTYFRDAKHVDEMKPGERPDTIYFQNLPTKWFLERSSHGDKPSEFLLKRVFETFGEIRVLEIPSIHKPYLENEAFKKISTFDQELTFDAYIQYKEYMGFVRAMDSLKGMKLVFINSDGKAYAANIKVDFDKSKYLSSKSIQLRSYQRLNAVKLPTKVATEENKKEVNKSKKREIAYEVKSAPTLKNPTKSCQNHHHQKLSQKSIILSRAKLLRKKESTLLLKELLERVRIAEIEKQALVKEEQIAKEKEQQEKLLKRVMEEEKRRKERKAREKKKILERQEKILRQKLLNELKVLEEKKTEELREKLRKEIAGKKVLKSVLVRSHSYRTKKCHFHKKYNRN